jgi:hypothetical protein
MQWVVIPLTVMVLYVHLFTTVSTLYFESGRTLTLDGLWAHVTRNLGLRDTV